MQNNFSGTADAVAQVGTQVGNIVYNLPDVKLPEPRIPHEVPGPERFFTDRVKLRARLLADEPADGVRVIVLSGLGGIGKTALARSFSAAATGRFPGGEAYLDFAALKQTADGPVPMDAVVARLLHALGLDRRQQPESPADRQATLRTWAGGLRLLIVVDGATEAAQVRHLVVGAPGSVVLVTSDRQLGELTDAEVLTLEALDDADARELLAKICGAERMAADPGVAALVAYCGGLPLALRIAGQRLARNDWLTATELLAELEEDGMDAVEALVKDAVRTLPEPALRAFHLLAAVGLPSFTVPTLAALLGAPPKDARAAVRDLQEWNLLDVLPDGRYRLLDQVRRYAARTGGEAAEVVADAVDRLLHEYLVVALFADRRLIARERLRLGGLDVLDGRDEPFGDDAAAQDWFSGELPGLLAALEAGAGLGRAEPVWRLAEITAALTLNTRQPVELARIAEIGMAAASVAGRFDVRARLATLGSRAHLDLGHTERADEWSEVAVADAEQSRDVVVEASAWEFRGRFLEAAGRKDEAALAYGKAVDLNEAAGERRGAALARFFLAGVVGAAPEEYATLRDEFRVMGDERMAARVRIPLGLGYSELGDTQAAIAELEAAIGVFAQLKAVHYEAQALTALAEVALRAGAVDGARQALERVVEIYAATADRRGEQARRRLEEI